MSGIPDEILAALGIEKHSIRASHTLAGGVSAETWRIETDSEVLVVKRALEQLKVDADWHAHPGRINSEVAWLRFVDSFMPGATPKVLAHAPQLHCFSMGFLDYPLWKTELLEGTADMEFAAKVARQLAAIHSTSTHQPGVAEQFHNDSSFIDLRVEPYFLTTASRNPAIAEIITKLGYGVLENKTALMQGDISPKNILKGPDGAVFLDAETACFGDPAFDMAFCLTHLMLKALLHAKLNAGDADRFTAAVRLMLAEYLSAVDWEPPANIAPRISKLLLVIMLARVDGKSPVDYLDDRQQLKIRSFCTQAIANQASYLEVITRDWLDHIQN